VTQVKGFLLIPYSRNGNSRSLTRLHEVSGVKVPRPASPFMTHETPSYSEGWRLLYLVAEEKIELLIILYL
jgi:hypothetical protein